jgi:hypothetical protein
VRDLRRCLYLPPSMAALGQRPAMKVAQINVRSAPTRRRADVQIRSSVKDIRSIAARLMNENGYVDQLFT